MLSEKLTAYSRMTEQKLKELLDETSCAPVLNRSMVYSAFSGGKRVRPALCMAACELCGGKAEDALLAACAVELIHTYSLIHDDLPAMDNDDMRRGKPSSHKAFGEANAILAGDALQALAFLALAQCPCKNALEPIARGALQMVMGQSLDVNADGGAELLEALQDYKTGALIRAAVLSGAACANANAAQQEALTRFANAYGMLFQITDDILDCTGDAALLGKTVGKDEADGKVTFVSVYGLEGAKIHAQSYAKIASEAVSCVHPTPAFFAELIQFTLTRKS